MSINHLILIAFKPDADADAVKKVRKIEILPLAPGLGELSWDSIKEIKC
jgi:hypothetical protein